MVSESKTTSFLLRDIPKEFWARVKSAAYDDNMTIRDWLIKAVNNELKRKTD